MPFLIWKGGCDVGQDLIILKIMSEISSSGSVILFLVWIN